jgi:Glycoside-hydrolase family GH114
MKRLSLAAVTLAVLALTGGVARAAATRIPPPSAHGTLRIAGHLRDGGTVAARGLRWRPGRLPHGDRLLSFTVATIWEACAAPAGPCAPAADSTATPFAARRYVAGHADVGRYLRVTQTAAETVETDPATFTFHVLRSSQTWTAPRPVSAYPAGKAPATAFVNGLPERRTGSDSERFQLAAPHFNPADGAPGLAYRIDGRAWSAVPAGRVFWTGLLAHGTHRVQVRASNRAGTTMRSFRWRVTALPLPRPCRGCWHPPHLDATGRPMRWDWQIGRVAPLERTGRRAVDIYDIDGFLTTPPELRALHTRWQAATLPHPRAFCYLDLAWEDYRPDATPGRGRFPARTLGNVYYGYPQERWIDVRQLRRLEPLIERRIGMCAAKGFDAVELDDIDSFDPPSTTGFQLTPGDWQNFLAFTDNAVHRHGMAVLWKNSPLLAWWGRRYADGAVVEECYAYGPCFSAGLAGTSAYGITCTALAGPRPCGWDAFTSKGKWVGEDEYREDGLVCAPGRSCTGRHAFSAFCRAVYAPPNGFSALRMTDELDGTVFQPCPSGV